MSAARNKFSPEFRDRAVRMVDESRGLSVGVGGDDLDRWEGWPHDREEASRRVGPAAQAANDRERLKLLEREVTRACSSAKD